ncbi:hypothetical protein EI94DRAFT_1700009 [Lactarius quietus]|nr:hypothetical protein EI94DRAFT_1700009 [Lactarius quietus]
MLEERQRHVAPNIRMYLRGTGFRHWMIECGFECQSLRPVERSRRYRNPKASRRSLGGPINAPHYEAIKSAKYNKWENRVIGLVVRIGCSPLEVRRFGVGDGVKAPGQMASSVTPAAHPASGRPMEEQGVGMDDRLGDRLVRFEFTPHLATTSLTCRLWDRYAGFPGPGGFRDRSRGLCGGLRCSGCKRPPLLGPRPIQGLLLYRPPGGWLPRSTVNEDPVELFETTGQVELAEILFDGMLLRGPGVVQFAQVAEAEQPSLSSSIMCMIVGPRLRQRRESDPSSSGQDVKDNRSSDPPSEIWCPLVRPGISFEVMICCNLDLSVSHVSPLFAAVRALQ